MAENKYPGDQNGTEQYPERISFENAESFNQRQKEKIKRGLPAFYIEAQRNHSSFKITYFLKGLPVATIIYSESKRYYETTKVYLDVEMKIRYIEKGREYFPLDDAQNILINHFQN